MRTQDVLNKLPTPVKYFIHWPLHNLNKTCGLNLSIDRKCPNMFIRTVIRTSLAAAVIFALPSFANHLPLLAAGGFVLSLPITGLVGGFLLFKAAIASYAASLPLQTAGFAVAGLITLDISHYLNKIRWVRDPSSLLGNQSPYFDGVLEDFLIKPLGNSFHHNL